MELNLSLVVYNISSLEKSENAVIAEFYYDRNTPLKYLRKECLKNSDYGYTVIMMKLSFTSPASTELSSDQLKQILFCLSLSKGNQQGTILDSRHS